MSSFLYTVGRHGSLENSPPIITSQFNPQRNNYNGYKDLLKGEATKLISKSGITTPPRLPNPTNNTSIIPISTNNNNTINTTTNTVATTNNNNNTSMSNIIIPREDDINILIGHDQSGLKTLLLLPKNTMNTYLTKEFKHSKTPNGSPRKHHSLVETKTLADRLFTSPSRGNRSVAGSIIGTINGGNINNPQQIEGLKSKDRKLSFNSSLEDNIIGRSNKLRKGTIEALTSGGQGGGISYKKILQYHGDKHDDINMKNLKKANKIATILVNSKLNHNSASYRPLSAAKKTIDKSDLIKEKLDLTKENLDFIKERLDFIKEKPDLIKEKLDLPIERNSHVLLTNSPIKGDNTTFPKVEDSLLSAFMHQRPFSASVSRNKSNSRQGKNIFGSNNKDIHANASVNTSANHISMIIQEIEKDILHKYRPRFQSHNYEKVCSKVKIIFNGGNYDEEKKKIRWKASTHYFDERLGKKNQKKEEDLMLGNQGFIIGNLANARPKTTNSRRRFVSANSRLTLGKICGVNPE